MTRSSADAEDLGRDDVLITEQKVRRPARPRHEPATRPEGERRPELSAPPTCPRQPLELARRP